jgi:glycosyltransferase involved in cell wall biosynthesis
MRVCLFRAFPDPFRKSMGIYADQLLKGVKSLLTNNENIVDCVPDNLRLKPSYARYWDQYVRYQLFSRASKGDVNHVIDHGYGHLIHSLPAQRSIVTFHDSTVTKVKGVAYTTRLSLRYSLSAIRKAARVIADSQNSRRDLLELIDYPEDNVTVIYPGVDESFRRIDDREELRRRYGFPKSYILHVGHTLPYMNIERVLVVLDRLVNRLGIDTVLVKVGGAFTDEHHARIAALGLEKRIVHLGRLPFSDLPSVYNCADVLVYPSLYAGFGLPPLESMACGTPVVCSNRGSLPEVVGDAAVLLDPEDEARMAEEVAALLTDESMRRRYITKGLDRAREYNWSNTARQVLNVYREVAVA